MTHSSHEHEALIRRNPAIVGATARVDEVEDLNLGREVAIDFQRGRDDELFDCIVRACERHREVDLVGHRWAVVLVRVAGSCSAEIQDPSGVAGGCIVFAHEYSSVKFCELADMGEICSCGTPYCRSSATIASERCEGGGGVPQEHLHFHYLPLSEREPLQRPHRNRTCRAMPGEGRIGDDVNRVSLSRGEELIDHQVFRVDRRRRIRQPGHHFHDEIAALVDTAPWK
ncbi:hypothetical protein Rhow_000453 [Rhodococcus wratislaviensis]|uniref:Uncharacterized protein n=1 Tax=Rhodococcus wratislaviensis TaxID=44752 RepID=A0A402CMG5_RHOWR|nr:hypothetical protein Rhow_000453 [Rhodococcus wratislaviensis]